MQRVPEVDCGFQELSRDADEETPGHGQMNAKAKWDAS
jgi:hypothetical protein